MFGLRGCKSNAVDIKDAIKLAVMRSPAAWFEAFGTIQAKGGAILRSPDLIANPLQRTVSEVIEWCIDHEVPCRLLMLKPRQKGCSTFSVAAFYRWLSNAVKRGCIIGGAHNQGDNLFKMLRLYAENDEFAGPNKAQVLDREARWPNGSRAVQQTARNPEAGRSGTFEALISTEVARWSEEGVANAADVLAGLLKCVPDLPGTLVILETTANGASGDFYERWQKGITVEQMRAGLSGFVKIFAPWFVFEDSRRDPKLEGIESEDDYSEKEKELAAKYGLDAWQVAWMRWAIREECKGDFDTFCQDYPFDDESAFLRSGRRRFNTGCLAKMKAAATLYPPAFGVFETQGDEVVYRTTPAEEARVMRWEQPREGCAYLQSVDVMTGASQTSGEDPDNHAPLVWRKGYFEHGRGWVPPRLVCRLIGDWPEWERNKNYELRWDIDVLEEQVWRMSRYYGDCLIVPEMNMDRGLVELLKLRGANIYEREIFNRREQTVNKALGWMTDTRTREMAIEVFAKHIREYGHDNGGADIHCPILLAEAESFIVKANGRSEAMGGKHDDNVMSAAIGLATLEGATVFRRAVHERPLPRDLRRAEAAMQRGVGAAQYS